MDLIFIMAFMALILFITANQSSSENVTAADEFNLLLIILIIALSIFTVIKYIMLTYF